MSAIIENVTFLSEGHRLLGRIYRPNAPGRFPGVVICHGYPGDNRNMDLAEELSLNGIAVLIFYYRGAWESEGTFSFLGLDPSTRDAVEHLRSQPSVDPDRIGIIGYSMGAIPVAKRLSEDSGLKAGVFISPSADVGPWALEGALESIVPSFLRMGEGKLRGLSADKLRAELPLISENLNPVEIVRDVRAPILVVAGSEDNTTPPELCKILYDGANEPKRWLLLEGTDHSYAEHRIPLIEGVMDWLKEHL